jgi:hypothetical protein
MATFYRNVDVDIDINLDDFDDDEIINYIERQGYIVSKEQEIDYTDVVWYVQRGDLKEALILLERKIPELKGIASLN